MNGKPDFIRAHNATLALLEDHRPEGDEDALDHVDAIDATLAFLVANTIYSRHSVFGGDLDELLDIMNKRILAQLADIVETMNKEKEQAYGH